MEPRKIVLHQCPPQKALLGETIEEAQQLANFASLLGPLALLVHSGDEAVRSQSATMATLQSSFAHSGKAHIGALDKVKSEVDIEVGEKAAATDVVGGDWKRV